MCSISTRRRGRKGQIWVSDFVVGMLIFGLAGFIFFKAYANFIFQRGGDFDELLIDAKSISNVMVYTGYPQNWTEADVQRIGITDGTSTINQTKLRRFKNLSLTDYQRTKELLGVNHDYLIIFQEAQGNPINVTDNVSSVGPPSVGLGAVVGNASVDVVAKISRFITYQTNSSPSNRTKETGIMVVYTWQT